MQYWIVCPPLLYFGGFIATTCTQKVENRSMSYNKLFFVNVDVVYMDVNAKYLHIAWHVVLYCVTSMLIKIMQYKGVYSLRTDFQVLGVVKLKYTLDSILTTSSTLKSVCSTKRVHIALSCETYTLQNNTCYKFATYFF